MNFKLGELFCGPGGMALGAKLAAEQFQKQYGDDLSIDHVWGVDRDPNAIKTYNANSLGEGIQCDAMAFAEARSGCDHETIADFPRITALAFGFPCNDFSMVGKRKGTNGNYGLLYKAGIVAIEHTNPKWFIAENVSGIHSANAGDAFRQILAELKAAGKGYNLTVNLYKFEDYGVPQCRHRYIIVGIRKDQQVEFKIPAPTHLNNHVTVKTALERPYKGDVSGREFTRQSERIVERLRFIPPWENAWFLDKLHDEMAATERRAVVGALPWSKELEGVSDNLLRKRIDECRLLCTKARMSHIYRRLHPDKPSYTITGSGGGGTHVYHWCEHRALTNRERARLQGFPDYFEFKGQKEQVRKQIGMAVPPEGAKIIFEAILKTFARIDYPSI
jgi:DNA (cytosine-5)-methyltransferase 1